MGSYKSPGKKKNKLCLIEGGKGSIRWYLASPVTKLRESVFIHHMPFPSVSRTAVPHKVPEFGYEIIKKQCCD